jgi:hypothetical protein
MKTVILSHKVNDYKEWKKHYDADTPRRTRAGLKQLAVGTKSDDKQDVYMIFQTSDVSVAEKMMNDPDMKATMKKAGVISEPRVLIID